MILHTMTRMITLVLLVLALTGPASAACTTDKRGCNTPTAYASGTLTSGATGAVPSYAESTNYPAADLAAIKAGVNLVRNFMGSNNK